MTLAQILALQQSKQTVLDSEVPRARKMSSNSNNHVTSAKELRARLEAANSAWRQTVAAAERLEIGMKEVEEAYQAFFKEFDAIQVQLKIVLERRKIVRTDRVRYDEQYVDDDRVDEMFANNE